MNNIIDYTIIELFEVTQKDKSFYVGKIKAKELLEIYTVRPAIYDIEKNVALAETFPNEREYYNHLISSNKEAITDKDFQRKYSDSRVNEVKKFLEEEEYAFFPNTIIANCDLINDIDDLGIDEESSVEKFINAVNIPKHLSFFQRQGNNYKLYIPKTTGSILVIDGQHRLEGLKRANEKVKDGYELLIAFIIGYDRSVIAQQFYTINYQQKPVNRSLLYHLMGEFSSNLDELSFIHKVVKALNELEQSPFYKRVKMLGVTPQNICQEDKKLLSISLAFLIDSLSRSVKPNSSSGIYQPIFRYYYLNKEYQIEIIKFLMNFFSAVKEKSKGWERPSDYLLSKGMGVGALIKLLYLIFPKIFIEEWNGDPRKIQQTSTSDIIGYLDGIENVDFSKEGPFGGVGSAGSVNKIKETLVENIKFFNTSSYEELEKEYRNENSVLHKYKKWLAKNI